MDKVFLLLTMAGLRQSTGATEFQVGLVTFFGQQHFYLKEHLTDKLWLFRLK